MEVAARGSGGALTPGSTGTQGSNSRVRLNITLYVVAILCVAAVGYLGARMWNDHERDGGDRAGNWFEDTFSVITDKRVGEDADDLPADTRAGEDVGGGVAQALEQAPADEQERTADQIEAASRMVNAFLNLRHDQIDANFAAVESLATGPFKRQWHTATTSKRGLAALITRAKAIQTGEVVWAGLVAGDADSADVIVATNGTIANVETDFEPQARAFRLQLRLELVDGQWLTSDLQYVR